MDYLHCNNDEDYLFLNVHVCVSWLPLANFGGFFFSVNYINLYSMRQVSSLWSEFYLCAQVFRE